MSEENKNTYLAAFIHLLGLFTNVPFIYLIEPFISDKFAKRHAVEAINFQLTIILSLFISIFLVYIIIGIILAYIVGIVNIVFTIVAINHALKGKEYKHPVSIKFFKS